MILFALGIQVNLPTQCILELPCRNALSPLCSREPVCCVPMAFQCFNSALTQLLCPRVIKLRQRGELWLPETAPACTQKEPLSLRSHVFGWTPGWRQGAPGCGQTAQHRGAEAGKGLLSTMVLSHSTETRGWLGSKAPPAQL